MIIYIFLQNFENWLDINGAHLNLLNIQFNYIMNKKFYWQSDCLMNVPITLLHYEKKYIDFDGVS